MARLPGLLGHSPYLLVEVFCTFRQSIDVKFGPKGLSANAGEINQSWAEKQKTAVVLNHRPTPGVRQVLRYKTVKDWEEYNFFQETLLNSLTIELWSM